MKDETCFKPLGEPHLLKAKFDPRGLLSSHGRTVRVLLFGVNKAVTSDYLSPGHFHWPSAMA